VLNGTGPGCQLGGEVEHGAFCGISGKKGFYCNRTKCVGGNSYAESVFEIAGNCTHCSKAARDFYTTELCSNATDLSDGNDTRFERCSAFNLTKAEASWDEQLGAVAQSGLWGFWDALFATDAQDHKAKYKRLEARIQSEFRPKYLRQICQPGDASVLGHDLSVSNCTWPRIAWGNESFLTQFVRFPCYLGNATWGQGRLGVDTQVGDCLDVEDCPFPKGCVVDQHCIPGHPLKTGRQASISQDTGAMSKAEFAKAATTQLGVTTAAMVAVYLAGPASMGASISQMQTQAMFMYSSDDPKERQKAGLMSPINLLLPTISPLGGLKRPQELTDANAKGEPKLAAAGGGGSGSGGAGGSGGGGRRHLLQGHGVAQNIGKDSDTVMKAPFFRNACVESAYAYVFQFWGTLIVGFFVYTVTPTPPHCNALLTPTPPCCNALPTRSRRTVTHC